MIQYILECIAFQLVFLIIYDFFLKRETFFQWNRAYLIGTYVLSMVLPWVKIEELKTTVPQEYYTYPEALWSANHLSTNVTVTEGPSMFTISWEEGILFGGMFFASLYFGYKLYQIQKLRKNGSSQNFPNFTRVIVKNSELAFSFFKSIFLGDKIVQRDYESIIQHELVHIEQKHSIDLLFFELMRIVGWFNPLVYVYQSRISELHEFIADAKVAKTHKKEQYQFLLSQVFQTENISFVNQFFKSSLIKKRIVMLQKSKSKRIFKLKYLALLPIVLGMVFYASCEIENIDTNSKETIMLVEDITNLSEADDQKLFSTLKAYSDSGKSWEFLLKDDNSSIKYTSSSKESYIKFDGHEEKIFATMVIEGPDSIEFFGSDMLGITISYAVVEEVPIFPGCENAENRRACFQTRMRKHISKNFRYPQKAQEEGIQGRVNVMFTIAADGSIQNVRKRGPHPLLEEEVVRIISKLPQMSPGKNKGQTVNVPFSIPITFKLDGSESNQKAVNLDYEKLKNKQLSELPNKIQSEYKGAIPFSIVDEVPIFPGCENAENKRACFQEKIQRHISKHFRYPKEAQEKGIQGRVSIMFIMSTEGNITNISRRGPDKLLENEAERIISKLPKLKPGVHNGEKVNVPFSIPITFKLQ